jgi:hypothetical protein
MHGMNIKIIRGLLISENLTFSAFSGLFTAVGKREWPYIRVSDGNSNYSA